MENGGADRCSDFRAIGTRSGAVRSRCETNLIVNNDMNGSSNGIIIELLHLKALIDDALSGHGSITVNDYGYDLGAIFLFSTEEMLLGSSSTSNHRVYSFQVRWIGE